ncbi:hypothetical protein PIB30_059055 [Stylosanthes scabra]|uniref:DUF4283 domain-containing protein n=1 Tax=Stylosanthes scabra TaxID=79078 RepID=A0ABU6ZIW6_9FABA|nr:hypothetical protein [Stylosanthes scabra]
MRNMKELRDSVTRFRRSVSAEKEGGLFKSDIQGGVERCSKSLIGRLLADRSFTAGTIKSALYSIWRQPEGFKVSDRGGNTFQFFFHDEKDFIRIERGGPWLFKNYIWNLKRWKLDKQFDDADFVHVPIWIQFWGLPEHYKTKEFGVKLGSSFGDVSEADVFQVRGKENSIVKVRPIERKPIPVNLIKNMANLSVHSQASINREEGEVMSISKPTFLPTSHNAADSVLKIKYNFMLRDATEKEMTGDSFVFHVEDNVSQISTKKESLKQQARRKFIKVLGAKRCAQGGKEDQVQKKRCSEGNTTAEEGEGATPQ